MIRMAESGLIILSKSYDEARVLATSMAIDSPFSVYIKKNLLVLINRLQ